jgi:hypothetical protein
MVRRRAEMKKAGIEAGSMRVLLDSATGSAQKSACPCSGSAWTEGKDIEVIMPSAPIRIRPGEDGQLIVQLPYSPDHVAKIKTVAGRRWHPKEKYWTVAHTNGVLAHLLALLAGEPVEVEPSLRPANVSGTRQISHEPAGDQPVATTLTLLDAGTPSDPNAALQLSDGGGLRRLDSSLHPVS